MTGGISGCSHPLPLGRDPVVIGFANVSNVYNPKALAGYLRGEFVCGIVSRFVVIRNIHSD